MRGVVVRDQMQFKVGRRVAINLLEKAQSFDVRVARLGASDQRAGQLDKSGKQSDCAMPRIVVRHRACAFGRQRKPELRAFERLALAFLIAAQHEGFGRRIEVEPDHVPEFLFEFRIIREFEGLHAMRLH